MHKTLYGRLGLILATIMTAFILMVFNMATSFSAEPNACPEDQSVEAVKGVLLAGEYHVAPTFEFKDEQARVFMAATGGNPAEVAGDMAILLYEVKEGANAGSFMIAAFVDDCLMVAFAMESNRTRAGLKAILDGNISPSRLQYQDRYSI